jgi:phosphoglycerol transferase MdoB-like AlkP superfamily enzyme
MTGRTMQKLLEVVSVLALLVAGIVTLTALYGSNAVQAVEPMTNPFSNHERDWGTRARLIEIPAVMLIVYVFGLLLTRYSHLLNFPVQVTAENYANLQILAKSMISWLKVEVLILFAWLQIIQIQIARETRSGIPIRAFQAFTVVVFASALIHYIAIKRQAP